MQSIYKELITSKTGIILPVLQSGKTLESTYNPERDAERKIQSLNISENFLLVLGFGSGILIRKLIEIFPDSKIFCVEFSKTDIDFLKKIPGNESLIEKIHIFSKEEIYNSLIQNYIPSLYGNLKIIEQTNYLSENQEYTEYLRSEIQRALSDISKDYSVQAHFGKLWQHNILNNYKGIINTESKTFNITYQNKVLKKCAVLAAGPTLDKKIPYLIQNRKDYFILATDTAFQAAEKSGITCDAVITLDAQNVSTTHFTRKLSNNTIFLVEYSSSPSIIKKIRKTTDNILFFTTGHPLTDFIANKNKSLHLNSGSGTVTIAALDFALKAGFKDIEIFGADFSFPYNKPYAKGTYLDTLYNNKACKINNSETVFSKLMFRTELKNVSGTKTTSVLEGYKESFERYLTDLKIPFEIKQNVYVIKNSYENISKEFSNSLLTKEKIAEKIKSENQNLKTALLPFTAFLQRTTSEKNLDLLHEQAENDFRRYLNL